MNSRIAKLEQYGFDGFLPIEQIFSVQIKQKLGRCIPNRSGVYLVVRENDSAPEFLGTSTGGRFKGRNPSVSKMKLKNAWVENAILLYVGKSNCLSRRIGELANFGHGKPVGHWGGRYLWHLQDAKQLKVCWKVTPTNRLEDAKKNILEEFKRKYGGKLPFANLDFKARQYR